MCFGALPLRLALVARHWLGGLVDWLGIWPHHPSEFSNFGENHTAPPNVLGIFYQTNGSAGWLHVSGRHCAFTDAGSRLAVEFNQRCGGLPDQCAAI